MECLTSRLPGKRRTRRRVSWVPLLEATEGLLSIVPAGMDEPDVSLHPRAQEQKFIFELTGDSMVNLWVPGASSRDLTLRLSGKTLEQPLISKKSGLSGGESISLRLPKGVYTFTIADLTDYAHVLNGSTLKQINFHPETNIKIDPYNSADIEGRVSINGSKEVMPVSMRVAEFFTDENNEVKRKTDYNLDPKNGGVSKLNPNLPVWVVVHGMNSGETSGSIDKLTQTLRENPEMKDMQIVTIDWSDAAKDPTNLGFDDVWTTAIGSWTAHQLVGLGFSPNQISGIGHSHGTYILVQLGETLIKEGSGQTMRTLIALDPAGHIPGSSKLDRSNFNFSRVSLHSVAIDSSFGVGSDPLSETADVSFKIRSPETMNPAKEHSLATAALTDILSSANALHTTTQKHFGISRLQTPFENTVRTYEENQYSGNFEGWIDIGNVQTLSGPDGNWYTANAIDIEYIKKNSDQSSIEYF